MKKYVSSRQGGRSRHLHQIWHRPTLTRLRVSECRADSLTVHYYYDRLLRATTKSLHKFGEQRLRFRSVSPNGKNSSAWLAFSTQQSTDFQRFVNQFVSQIFSRKCIMLRCPCSTQTRLLASSLCSVCVNWMSSAGGLVRICTQCSRSM